jgi:CelD/BcsL family acetyltransferase involved in cellulose biosynthesis
VSRWGALAATRPPLAPFVGPFPHGGFLEAWWGHHGSGDLHIVDGGTSAVAMVVDDGTARLAGDSDITDYHTPVGDGVGELAEGIVATLPQGTRLSFDSLPIEAAEALAKGLERCGIGVSLGEHETTMILHLGGGDFLDSLDAKQRHEIRRKERRFEERLGPASVVEDAALFDVFVAMHRSSGGEKGRFMTDGMEAFFADLLTMPGTRLDGLVTESGTPVAAAFGFEDEGAYYLYNAAFDVDFGDASPGIVLLHRLIRRVEGEGGRRFDFLKGSEPYKRRLGAEPRPLYLVEGVV